MKRTAVTILCALLVVTLSGPGFTATHTGKKVLFIDSYHEGYAWSDGIGRGINSILDGTGVELKVVRMDTKRNKDAAFKEQAALKAKQVIEEFGPDVVIAADDNASKYLIKPYYKDASLPFVFCGVNWDEKVYDYPYANVTGMVEVTPVPQLIEQLQPMANGDRVGFLGPDILTAHKEAENYKKAFGLDTVTYYAKDVEDWKRGFVELQSKVDILLIASHGGLYVDHEAELQAFAASHTKIPTGASYDFMAPFAMITYGKVAEEQGGWSATTALEILQGKAPSSIPITKNTQGKLIINTKIAKVMGASIPYEILEAADQVIE